MVLVALMAMVVGYVAGWATAALMHFAGGDEGDDAEVLEVLRRADALREERDRV